MFFRKKPPVSTIVRCLERQKSAPFNYAEVGASVTGRTPVGYGVNHGRFRLGQGEATYQKAIAAIQGWEMFRLGWTEAVPSAFPPAKDAAVAIVAHTFGIWSLNLSRVHTLIDEHTEDQRWGFVYGTLPTHVARGEERFTVEHQRRDDSVWYDVFSFSRPNHLLAIIGLPFMRRVQHRFIKESGEAMARAVQ